jgi:hypothetical protein
MLKSKTTKRRFSKDVLAEIRRRRLYGGLRNFLRDRCCGPVLPDDDAGREYLTELLLMASLSQSETVHWGPTDRMRCVTEVWTPWMSEGEARDFRLEINAIPEGQRWAMLWQMGERLQLTFAERERHRLWDIDAYDVPKEAMPLFRKRKKRQRDTLRRRARGAKPRAEFLAASFTQTKPWIAAGFNTRRTWERKGKPGVAGPRQVKLIRTELGLATRPSEGLDVSANAKSTHVSVFPTATPAGPTGTCVTAGSSREAA